MNLKITEHDTKRCFDPQFCTLEQFKEVNADGIEPWELEAIEATLRAGRSYNLGVAVGAFALIETA